jgi:hypothetical protein
MHSRRPGHGGPAKGLTQKYLYILYADASVSAALRNLGICQIFLRFHALPKERPNA